MTSNQDPNSKPLTWSEKRAIYLSQAQNDPSSTPASTSTPTSLANQADSPQPSHKSPAIPPRLQGADDPNFLNQIGSKQGNNSNASNSQSLFPGLPGHPIPPRRGSSTSAHSSVDDSQSSDAPFSRKNLVLQAVSNGQSSSGIASSVNPQGPQAHGSPSLGVPNSALSTPLPPSGRSSPLPPSGRSSPLPSTPSIQTPRSDSDSRAHSPDPSSTNVTPTPTLNALPPFSSATTSSPFLNARTQAVGQNNSGRSNGNGSSPNTSSSVGLAKYLAQQQQNSMSSSNPNQQNIKLNQSNYSPASSSASMSNGRIGHSSNYAPSFRSVNADPIGSSPTRSRSSTNPPTPSIKSESYQQSNSSREFAAPPPRKKEKKASSFLMDNDFNLSAPMSTYSQEKEKEKKLKRTKSPEGLDPRKGGNGIDSEQNWNNTSNQSHSSGGVVNALGHFGGIVGRRGWDFVKGLNGPSSPAMGSSSSNNSHFGSDPISNSSQQSQLQQTKTSNSRSQSPLPPPPSHPNRGMPGQASTIGHASSQSLSLGQMSGVAFNALKRGAGAAATAASGGGFSSNSTSEPYRTSQDLSRNPTSRSQSLELNEATRKWLSAPEPAVGGPAGMNSNALGGRNAATTGRARGKHSNSISSYQALSSANADAKGVFGMELKDAVLRTRLGRPLISDSNANASNIQNLDLDLGNEFGLSDSDVLRVTSSSNPNSRRSSANQAPSPNPKPKRLSSNKIKTSSSGRKPYSREEARIRCLPCIVTRCIESLERFGTSEEGIYRLSGRTSHTSKLRSIFDAPVSAPSPASSTDSTFNKSSGKTKAKSNSISTNFTSNLSTLPDLELSEIGPAELDLNSVCSVLKQYLRDLPEPLLGRELVKEFDEKCNLITGRPSSGGALGMGLVGNQTPAAMTQLAQSKNPAAGIPQSSGSGTNESKEGDAESQAANQIGKLAEEIEPLMNRIPCQNWYLLREIALHLTDLTKDEVVKVTKMPLSNLCLVLAPTLSISGVLLRALVIHHQRLFSAPPPTDEDIDVPIAGWTQISSTSTTPQSEVSNLSPTALAATSMEDRRGSTMTLRPRSNTQPTFNSNYQFSFGLPNGHHTGSDTGHVQIISGAGRSSPSGIVIPANSSGLDSSSRSTSPWTLASAPSSSQEDLDGEPKIARKFIKTGGLMNMSSSNSLSSNQSDGNSNLSHSDQSHRSYTNSTSNSNSIDHRGNLVDDESSSISTSSHDGKVNSNQKDKPVVPTKPSISALDRPRPPTRGSFYSSFTTPVIPTRSRRRNNAADSDTSNAQSPALSPTFASSGFNLPPLTSAGITLLGNNSSSTESPKLDLDFESMRLGAAEGVKGDEQKETPLAFEERRKMWEGR